MKALTTALAVPLLVFPLMLFSLLMGNANGDPNGACVTPGITPIHATAGTGHSSATTTSEAPLTSEAAVSSLMQMRFSNLYPLITRAQAENILTIAHVARELEVPRFGLQIAIATAIQESMLNNINFGDRDSVGLFQQRTSMGWGTHAQIMDPTLATRAFFGRAEHTSNPGLLDVAGWESLQLTAAAQAVQRSGFPNAYAQWAAGSGAIADVVGSDLVSVPPGECPMPVSFCSVSGVDQEVATSCGDVTWPVPAIHASSDRHNWGGSGVNWDSWHTGTDFSVACGTPVLAAHAGTVVVETSEAWSGPWLVKVSQGPGSLTTWYAHMETLSVSRGDQVAAGQQIGLAGAEGNSTGCHLHFEVHERNGSIYGPDNVNASDWLDVNAKK